MAALPSESTQRIFVIHVKPEGRTSVSAEVTVDKWGRATVTLPDNSRLIFTKADAQRIIGSIDALRPLSLEETH